MLMLVQSINERLQIRELYQSEYHCRTSSSRLTYLDSKWLVQKEVRYLLALSLPWIVLLNAPGQLIDIYRRIDQSLDLLILKLESSF